LGLSAVPSAEVTAKQEQNRRRLGNAPLLRDESRRAGGIGRGSSSADAVALFRRAIGKMLFRVASPD
jgi:hypothetical protein